MRRLGIIPALSVIGVALVTIGAHFLGPRPVVRTVSSTLNDPKMGLIEPADRAALIGWWLLAIVLALSVTFWVRRYSDRSIRGRRHRGHAVALILGALAAAVTIVSVTWANDVTELWSGIPLPTLLLGVVVAAGILGLWRAPRPIALAGTVGVAGVALAYVIPALIQIPSGLRDPGNYRFTSDEMVAVAAGRFPLADYIPQYNGLLGFPVAPILHWFPARSELIVLGWLILLQVVALAVAVALPVLAGGWRHLAPALILACAPPLIALKLGNSASTYFADVPMRVVLPSITILATYLALRRRLRVRLRRPGRFLLVGAIAGLSALSNPDYGVPVLVAVAVVVVLAGGSLSSRAISGCAVAAGALAVFLGYGAIGTITHHAVNWSNWLAFQRVFGAEGFAAEPMEPFGLHIAVVALFVSTSVVGFVLIMTSRPGGSSFAFRQGVLLALCGGWGLLSLPYFAGRSLAPTLIGGYTYTIGLVVAALLPLVHHSYRAIRAGLTRGSVAAPIGLGLSIITIASVAASATFIWSPSTYIGLQTTGASGRSQPLRNVIQSIESVESAPGNARLRELIAGGHVVQSLYMPGLVALTTGLRSVAIASNPEDYSLSPFFVSAFCNMPWPDDAEYLLVGTDVAGQISQSQSCTGDFDLSSTQTFSDGTTTYALLKHVNVTS